MVAVSLEPPSAERVRQSVEFSSLGPGLLPSCCAWALPNPRTTALPHLPIITASQIIHNIIQRTLCHWNPFRQRGETTEHQDFASHCLQAFPFPQALGGNTSSAKNRLRHTSDQPSPTAAQSVLFSVVTQNVVTFHTPCLAHFYPAAPQLLRRPSASPEKTVFQGFKGILIRSHQDCLCERSIWLAVFIQTYYN